MRRRTMIIDKGRVLRIVRLALPVTGWGSADNPLRLDRQINCLLLLRFGLAAVYKNSNRPMEGSISVSQSASQPFLHPPRNHKIHFPASERDEIRPGKGSARTRRVIQFYYFSVSAGE